MKWRPDPPALLSLPCTGSLSEPKQDCDRRIDVPFPIDLNKLAADLRRHGWFVTVTTPPGTNPRVMAILCGHCAEALVPELVAAAKKAWKAEVS